MCVYSTPAVSYQVNGSRGCPSIFAAAAISEVVIKRRQKPQLRWSTHRKVHQLREWGIKSQSNGQHTLLGKTSILTSSNINSNTLKNKRGTIILNWHFGFKIKSHPLTWRSIFVELCLATKVSCVPEECVSLLSQSLDINFGIQCNCSVVWLTPNSKSSWLHSLERLLYVVGTMCR